MVKHIYRFQKILTALSIIVLVFITKILNSDSAPDFSYSVGERIKASASSILIEPGKNESTYSPEKAMDKSNKTFWCEGKEDDGVGETLKITWKPRVIEGLLVAHGVLLNKKYFEFNNRIKDYEATFFLAGGREKTIKGNFKDYDYGRWERINLWGCTTGVEIKILSVYPGTKFKDTCISDIYLVIPDPNYSERAKEENEKCK